MTRRCRCLFAILMMVVLMAGLMTGCGNNDDKNATKVVLTTGFDKDEIFRIQTSSCTLPEIMVYLTNIQNRYEKVYGGEIWNTSVDGVTLQENVKNTAIAQIAKIKTMNLMADQYEVELSEDELALCENAAKMYFSSLNATEIEKMGVTEQLICKMYEEFALAQKVYEYTIRDINPEISDDEARTITVQHILIKTYALDGTGKKIEYTDAAKKRAYEEACEILEYAKEGQDFDELIRKYSEDDKGTYSFGKGEMDPAFDAAAFNLGKDEISEVVESEFGYHIIKCLNTFNKEETDDNKIKIVDQRREEAFEQEYSLFADSITKNLNEELWNSVSFIHDEKVTTQDFFDVYTEYFGK